MIKYIIYILVIAVITMILVYIGIIKDKRLALSLADKLYSKCCNKVLKALKKKDKINIVEIRNLIKDEKTGMVWSKRKLSITNKVQFTNLVIEGLLKLDKIEQIDNEKRIYKLK